MHFSLHPTGFSQSSRVSIADFGLHSGVIFKISGSIWVSGVLSGHILITVSFGVDFLFRIQLSAALSDHPVFRIKDPVVEQSNDVSLHDRYFSPGIFSGLYCTIFSFPSGIFITICRYPLGCTFRPDRRPTCTLFFWKTPECG